MPNRNVQRSSSSSSSSSGSSGRTVITHPDLRARGRQQWRRRAPGRKRRDPFICRASTLTWQRTQVGSSALVSQRATTVVQQPIHQQVLRLRSWSLSRWCGTVVRREQGGFFVGRAAAVTRTRKGTVRTSPVLQPPTVIQQRLCRQGIQHDVSHSSQPPVFWQREQALRPLAPRRWPSKHPNRRYSASLLCIEATVQSRKIDAKQSQTWRKQPQILLSQTKTIFMRKRMFAQNKIVHHRAGAMKMNCYKS